MLIPTSKAMRLGSGQKQQTPPHASDISWLRQSLYKILSRTRRHRNLAGWYKPKIWPLPSHRTKCQESFPIILRQKSSRRRRRLRMRSIPFPAFIGRWCAIRIALRVLHLLRRTGLSSYWRYHRRSNRSDGRRNDIANRWRADRRHVDAAGANWLHRAIDTSTMASGKCGGGSKGREQNGYSKKALHNETS